MEYFIAIIVLAAVIILISSKSKKKRTPHTAPIPTSIESSEQEQEPQQHDYTSSYKQKWLFTYNEKEAYRKIKEITDNLDMHLLAKVRLLDLVEPKKDCENYKGAFWKIQAKHVDFVVCDSKLVARTIIELDDSSHKQQARQERDDFVDKALRSSGYRVIHIEAIIPEELTEFLKT
jgi:hypothetical protein